MIIPFNDALQTSFIINGGRLLIFIYAYDN